MGGLIIGAVLGAGVAHWFYSRRLGRAGDAAGPTVARTRSGLLTEPVRTGPVARLLFRALARLYDLGLGRLVGHRFLRLTHHGRRSGRLYHTVVEVISYDPATRESVVLSGWGDRADWYRNLQVAPAVEILTAGQRYTPVQRFVEPCELYTHLLRYLERNRPLRPVVTRTLGLQLDGSGADRARLEARGYRGVAFRPAPSGSAGET